MTFQTVVKTIAGLNGIFADFSPKPLENKAGNGFHINMSVKSPDGTDCMDSMIAGILDKISDMTVFLNPAPDSYKRFGQNKAPRYISWSLSLIHICSNLYHIFHIIHKDLAISDVSCVKNLFRSFNHLTNRNCTYYNIYLYLWKQICFYLYASVIPVSYTHLDVYKRQVYHNICSMLNWTDKIWCAKRIIYDKRKPVSVGQ